jgi:hypothetical protein
MTAELAEFWRIFERSEHMYFHGVFESYCIDRLAVALSPYPRTCYTIGDLGRVRPICTDHLAAHLLDQGRLDESSS